MGGHFYVLFGYLTAAEELNTDAEQQVCLFFQPPTLSRKMMDSALLQTPEWQPLEWHQLVKSWSLMLGLTSSSEKENNTFAAISIAGEKGSLWARICFKNIWTKSATENLI